MTIPVYWITFFVLVALLELVRIFLSFRKNYQISKALSKRNKEISYINFLTTFHLSNNVSIQDSFPKLLNILKETVGWTYHSIYRLDESTQLLSIRFTGYLPDWFMEEMSTKVKVKVGDVALGRSVATKQPVAINAAIIDPRFKDTVSLFRRQGFNFINSIACCPLIGRIKTYGGFCTYSAFKNIYTLRDTQFLLTCANLYGAIMERNFFNNYLISRK